MLNEALDHLATTLEAGMQLRVTRDPGSVIAPCVFVDFPTVKQATLAAATMQVPVYLVAPAPGDLRASTWLLDNTPKFLRVLSAQETEPRPLSLGDTTHPAVMATAVITVRTN
jgi:hypothetical protein